MIDQLRNHLELLNENFVEKNAVFKIKVIPFFCAVTIKKDHKQEGKLNFYSNQLIEILMIILFILFGLGIYDVQAGITHGPVHIAIAVFISLNLIIKQIAIESLKNRLFYCRLKDNRSDEMTHTEDNK
ncbi:hypothetical protein [Pseudoalteromonas tunicata]|jgi:hypothetical protein|uniref:Uncharacterized protein n=1 Tax=Pseudoalteromonas tunicata D2 TaxID=87626 RepID=A4C4R2_9GAMM|nr:hypothetical protein [Pseudoalteromonas tunicata]ATC96977.1 hypothetical protein PTUN_b0623 [Pseudoalteromonas tunicata]AXT33100.1 hypothetical protein D1819_19980 [Pseudoalteromonas tunicata]EAR30544.1 hypothetical protein PTD2_03206 [Pseudoalteromonas tunicata D2]MDP4982136.1 hypothetical protein [Pseudoalteromonas tunicata]MDP5213901.1 hypothetical protein [Pseudoalteromonas tunicata]